MSLQCGTAEGKIACFNAVKITSNEVQISQKGADGWAIAFNKEPASVS